MSDRKVNACGLAFSEALKTLMNNMDGLRDFVLTVESHLKERQKKVVEKNAPDLAPIFLALRKLNPEGFRSTKISDDELEKRFGGKIAINIKDEGDGKKSAQIDISGEGGKGFDRAMKEFGKSNQSINLLYSNTLISLLSSVELFLSQLIHLYYREFPDAITSKDKVFSFEDLKAFDSVEDARSFLIEARVENILRGSFEDWMTFFKTHPKLSMGYLTQSEAKLTEACQRRNLIVHNGGIVNSIYLAKVSPDFSKKRKKGDQLLITSEYLQSRVDLFELNGLLIAFELWKKLACGDDVRGETLVDITFSHIRAGRWAVAEGLAYFLMNDKEMSEEPVTIGRLNYWLSIKRQNRWQEVKTLVEAEDMSAKSQRFQLAWLSLSEKSDEFFTLLPQVIKSEQLYREELRDFPIFDEMRRDKRCKRFLPKPSAKEEQEGN